MLKKKEQQEENGELLAEGEEELCCDVGLQRSSVRPASEDSDSAVVELQPEQELHAVCKNTTNDGRIVKQRRPRRSRCRQ